MFKTLTLLAGAALAVATPAYADTSPYVEATTALNGHNADYGLKAGLNINSFTLEAGAENFIDRKPTYVVSAGIQPRLAGPLSAYGQVGYIHTGSNDGYRLGAGLVADLTKYTYVKGGYQRDDYGHGRTSDRGLIGLGVRF